MPKWSFNDVHTERKSIDILCLAVIHPYLFPILTNLYINTSCLITQCTTTEYSKIFRQKEELLNLLSLLFFH